MKLAVALLALLCLGALASAETVTETDKSNEAKPLNLQLPELKLPKLADLKLPELKLNELQLPKLQLPELKQQQENKPTARFRLSNLNATLPNNSGIELPKLQLPGGLNSQALKALQNITNAVSTDQLKAAAILAWLKDAGFYQLKNLTETGGKVVIDLGKDSPKPQEKTETEAPKAEEKAAPATTQASKLRTGSQNNKGSQQAKPAQNKNKTQQKPAANNANKKTGQSAVNKNAQKKSA